MNLPPAAEAMHFDGAPVAHIIAHQERERLARAERAGRTAARRILSPRWGR